MTIRLTDPSKDRYERLRLIRWWDQEKLKQVKVLVLGAGALGNEIAKNLALLGTGHVWIADFDRIENSNLTRSALLRLTDIGKQKAEVLARRAAEINPDSNFVPLIADIRHDLGLYFLSQMDLVFGCVDNREARYFANRYCYLLKKPFIDAGLDTLNGAVSVFVPPETACYECTLSRVDRLELQKRISCLKSSDPEIQHHIPTAPTIASLIAGLQSQIGIRYLHGLSIPAGKRLGLYGLSDVFFDIKLEISEDCGLHSAIDPLPRPELLECRETASVREVLAAARKRWNSDRLTWDFDRDLVTGLTCVECSRMNIFVGTANLYSGNAFCECGGTFKPQIANAYTGAEEWGDRSFRGLGFPSQHIFAADGPNGRQYFHLE